MNIAARQLRLSFMRSLFRRVLSFLGRPAVVAALSVALLADWALLPYSPASHSTLGGLFPGKTARRFGTVHGHTIPFALLRSPSGIAVVGTWEGDDSAEGTLISGNVFVDLSRSAGLWAPTVRVERLIVFSNLVWPAEDGKLVSDMIIAMERSVADGYAEPDTWGRVQRILRHGRISRPSPGQIAVTIERRLWLGYVHNAVASLTGAALLVGVPLCGDRIVRLRRHRFRVSRGMCGSCGYDLKGSPGGACPECGYSAGAAP